MATNKDPYQELLKQLTPEQMKIVEAHDLEVDNKITQLTSDKKDLTSSVEELNSKLSESEATLKAVNNQIAQLTSDKKDLTSSVEELNSKLSESEATQKAGNRVITVKKQQYEIVIPRIMISAELAAKHEKPRELEAKDITVKLAEDLIENGSGAFIKIKD